MKCDNLHHNGTIQAKKASFHAPIGKACVGLLLVFMVPAHAETSPEVLDNLTFLRSAQVDDVVDGDTVILDDGIQVRLVGIMAPKLPLGREGFVEQLFAKEAKEALAGLVLNQDVDLYTGGAPSDRHGRILAHVFTSDGIWVQGALLEQGLARTYSFADNRSVVDLMHDREATARDREIGLWTAPFYRIHDAGKPGEIPVDSYELIEGVVLHVAEVDRRVYLNFGEDWRQDMTATISPDHRRIFRDSGFELEDLEGSLIRVRGWTQWYNGPAIELDHPEQIEVLEQ